MIGKVVRQRTDQSLPAEVRRQLFLPLDMETAAGGLDALPSSRRWARPHHASAHGWILARLSEAHCPLAPAAGVNAGLRDREPWLAAEMGTRPGVLRPAERAAVHAPGIDTPAEMRATPWHKARLGAVHDAMG